MFHLAGIDVDPSKLLTKTQLLEFLEENGEDDRAMSQIRERYLQEFGNELVWRYPISDGMHMGTFIVCVKEGFISVPFNIIDAVDYEILELKQTAMFDADAMQVFIEDWISFSEDLVGAMKDIHRILAEGK